MFFGLFPYWPKHRAMEPRVWMTLLNDKCAKCWPVLTNYPAVGVQWVTFLSKVSSPYPAPNHRVKEESTVFCIRAFSAATVQPESWAAEAISQVWLAHVAPCCLWTRLAVSHWAHMWKCWDLLLHLQFAMKLQIFILFCSSSKPTESQYMYKICCGADVQWHCSYVELKSPVFWPLSWPLKN